MRFFITFSYDGSKYKGYQKQPGTKTVQGELERVLKVVQENDEKEIKKEKKKRFLEEEKKAENQKEELIEFLLSEELMKIERRKLLQEKESSEIENEDIRKATDLILNCIKESKEEILKEIKKLIKD